MSDVKQKPPHRLGLIGFIALSSLCVGPLLFGMTWWRWQTFSDGPYLYGTIAGLVLVAMLSPVLWSQMRWARSSLDKKGRPLGWFKAATLFLVLPTLVTPLLMVSLVQCVNGAFDAGDVEIVEVLVANEYASPKKHYSLTLEGVEPGLGTLEMEVSGSVHRCVAPYEGLVIPVRVRPGALGWTWFEGFDVACGATAETLKGTIAP